MPSIEEARETYAVSTAFITSRLELPLVLNSRKLLGSAVEVGVKQGEYSEHLLTYWKGMRLTSVDPWAEAAATDYVDIANVPQMQQEIFRAETMVRLAPFGNRSRIMRDYSVQAAERFFDYTLDFCYIDARHDYASMLEDLAAWYPKMRPGGIFAGHDYLDAVNADGVFGVKSAVDEFFGARNIPVSSTLADGLYQSWIVAMPLPG